MPKTAAVINVRCQREQREVLSIEIVFEIEHLRKAGAGDLFFFPRAVRFLRTEQEAQPTLNAWPIHLAAGANAHHRPCSLRSGTLADAFGPRIVVRRTGLAPAAVTVLAALQPVAPAQYPVLRHVLIDGAQTAQHLPRAITVIYAPAAVPGTVVLLRLNQIIQGALHGGMIPVDADIAKQLKRPRGQIAAGRGENRNVVGNR